MSCYLRAAGAPVFVAGMYRMSAYNGIKADEIGSEVAFAASMKARGFEKAKRNIGAVWLGLMLLGEEEDEAA